MLGNGKLVLVFGRHIGYGGSGDRYKPIILQEIRCWGSRAEGYIWYHRGVTYFHNSGMDLLILI